MSASINKCLLAIALSLGVLSCALTIHLSKGRELSLPDDDCLADGKCISTIIYVRGETMIYLRSVVPKNTVTWVPKGKYMAAVYIQNGNDTVTIPVAGQSKAYAPQVAYDKEHNIAYLLTYTQGHTWNEYVIEVRRIADNGIQTLYRLPFIPMSGASHNDNNDLTYTSHYLYLDQISNVPVLITYSAEASSTRGVSEHIAIDAVYIISDNGSE